MAKSRGADVTDVGTTRNPVKYPLCYNSHEKRVYCKALSMQDKNSILSILHKYKERYGKEYGIEEIGLFGSYARGDAKEESDVDVFLKLKRSNLFLLSRIRIELEDLLDIRTNVVQLGDRMNRYLKKHIEQEAIRA